MIKGTLVLEGGAARCIFTSGVLDYLMEQDIYFNTVIGVSAGACNGVNYVAKQIGRQKQSVLHKEHPYKIINFKKMLKSRSILDMEVLFDSTLNEFYPLDYDQYFKSKTRCLIGVTNCLTAQVEYKEIKQGRESLLAACKASSSMPLVTTSVSIDNIPYLDGGIGSPIPIQEAIDLGEDKIVVVLTRNKGYRKTPSSKMLKKVYSKVYRKYPALVECMNTQYLHYNETISYIERLEAEGKIFVIRPIAPTIGRLESKAEVLEACYEHAYQEMSVRDKDLQIYLNA